MREIDCAAPEHAAGVLCACYAFLQQERLSLHVPFHAQAMFDLLGDVAERASIESTECYNVLCYERVLRACLELKAQRAPLADGAITFAIQGYAGRSACASPCPGKARGRARGRRARR